jgi:hypothetical protein
MVSLMLNEPELKPEGHLQLGEVCLDTLLLVKPPTWTGDDNIQVTSLFSFEQTKTFQRL